MDKDTTTKIQSKFDLWLTLKEAGVNQEDRYFIINAVRKMELLQRNGEIREAFMNIMADSNCYCDNLLPQYDICSYCENKQLYKDLLAIQL